MTTYTIAPQRTDEHGINRDRFTQEISSAYFDALDEFNSFAFQAAGDLPEGTEFARGMDEEGKPIKIYRR